METEAPEAAMPRARWTRLQANGACPSVRSHHAMTPLRGPASALLFGGYDGTQDLADVYLLERVEQAAPRPLQKVHKEDVGAPVPTRRSRRLRHCEPEQELAPASASASTSALPSAPATTTTASQPRVRWTKLTVAVAHAAATGKQPRQRQRQPARKPASHGDGDGHASAPAPLPEVDGGRSLHTMHYIPASASEERRRGLRVLVLGNVVQKAPPPPGGSEPATDDSQGDREQGATAARLHSGSQGTADTEVLAPVGEQVFEMEAMRVQELFVHPRTHTARWAAVGPPSMWTPSARIGHCSTVVGDRVFCFGGTNATCETFHDDLLVFDASLRQWRSPPTTGVRPSPRAFAAVAASPDGAQLFLVGGFNGRHLRDAYRFDIATGHWSRIPTRPATDEPQPQQTAATTRATATREALPGEREGHSLMFVGPHCALVVGGRRREPQQEQPQGQTQQNPCGSDLVVLNTTTLTWQPLQNSADAPMKGVGGHCAVPFAISENYNTEPSSTTTATPTVVVFGGYAGAALWLNDFYSLQLPPVDVLAPQTPVPRSSTSKNRHPSPPTATKGSAEATAKAKAVEMAAATAKLAPRGSQKRVRDLEAQQDAAALVTPTRPRVDTNSGTSGSSGASKASSTALVDITNQLPLSGSSQSTSSSVSPPSPGHGQRVDPMRSARLAESTRPSAAQRKLLQLPPGSYVPAALATAAAATSSMRGQALAAAGVDQQQRGEEQENTRGHQGALAMSGPSPTTSHSAVSSRAVAVSDGTRHLPRESRRVIQTIKQFGCQMERYAVIQQDNERVQQTRMEKMTAHYRQAKRHAVALALERDASAKWRDMMTARMQSVEHVLMTCTKRLDTVEHRYDAMEQAVTQAVTSAASAQADASRAMASRIAAMDVKLEGLRSVISEHSVLADRTLSDESLEKSDRSQDTESPPEYPATVIQAQLNASRKKNSELEAQMAIQRAEIMALKSQLHQPSGQEDNDGESKEQ